MVANFLIPLAIGVFILLGSKPSQMLATCLGQYELSYNNIGKEMCTGNGDILVHLTCQVAKVFYLILSSNIFDGFLLYPCFKKINEQNEHIKSAIGENSYIKRRR